MLDLPAMNYTRNDDQTYNNQKHTKMHNTRHSTLTLTKANWASLRKKTITQKPKYELTNNCSATRRSGVSLEKI